MQRAQGRHLVLASSGAGIHRPLAIRAEREFERHPLAVLDRMLIAAPLNGLLGSSSFKRYLRHRGIEAVVWVRSALLQQLYGIEHDARWVEALRFNVLYRWFVGLDVRGTDCWNASEHARAWLRLHGHPELLTAFRDFIRDARTVIPRSPPATKRDLAVIERHNRIPTRGVRPSDSGYPCPSVAALHRQDRIFERAMDVIRKRLTDASLSAEDISRALNVSRRTLYYVFRERGLSPTAVVRDERLERSRRALVDPARRHTKIITIAMDSGFKDISTFCRLFKSRYAMSPGAVRLAVPTEMRKGSAFASSQSLLQ